jgi:hypothetical protein
VPEPARTLSRRARWVWAAQSAAFWLVLLVLAVLWGGKLHSGLWVLPLIGLLVAPLGVTTLR